TNLDEIMITTNTQKTNIKKAEMSVNKLSMSTIKEMPAVLGEVDVLKSILQLPGVATAQEGASGFNVRGGSVDGNLVLLDEAVVKTIHKESFYTGSKTVNTLAKSKESHQVKILLKEKEHEVNIAAGTPILFAGLELGLDLPYSCQSGSCVSCAAKCI